MNQIISRSYPDHHITNTAKVVIWLMTHSWQVVGNDLAFAVPAAGGLLEVTVIRVYAEAGSVIETHKDKGDFKEW